MVHSVIEPLIAHFQHIGDSYGVNPFVFFFLYFVTVPLFWASTINLVRQLRKKKSVFWPIAGIIVSQLACYTYLVLSAQNLPGWVYLIIAGLIVLGAYKTWKYVQTKLELHEVMFR